MWRQGTKKSASTISFFGRPKNAEHLLKQTFDIKNVNGLICLMHYWGGIGKFNGNRF